MTREEAIRCLDVYSSTNGSGLCTDKQHYEAKQMAIKALEQEPKWIPVSERLPKKEMNCLVTDSLGKIHKVTFYHALDGRESYFSGCYCVRAWMPLPELFEAESEDEDKE